MKVPKESWFSPKIEVRNSPVHGKGTFAKGPIKKGEAVEIWGEYWQGKQTLEYTDDKEKGEAARKQAKAVMQWDTDLWSIEERGSDDGYFINHSCDSNLWFNDAFTLSARKDIEPEEELTLDYSLFERDDYVSDWQCSCGSPVCRKVITGKDWQREYVQGKYRNHFSPLINKRIARNDRS